jgi:hypothetical protein
LPNKKVAVPRSYRAQTASEWGYDQNTPAFHGLYIVTAEMRNLILTVTIVVGSSAILYLLAIAVGLPQTVAGGVAGVPAFASKNVYELLEIRSAKVAFVKVQSIASPDEFAVHPLSALVLAVAMFVGVCIITVAITSVLVSIAGINIQDPRLFFTLATFTSLPLRAIASVYIGRWIGGRSARYGLAIAIGSPVVGLYLTLLIQLLFIILFYSDQLFDALFPLTNSAHNTRLPVVVAHLSGAAINALPDVAICTISTAFGFWWGRRRRLTRYLAFILKVLPPETRAAIVEIARDEAVRIARPAAQAAK